MKEKYLGTRFGNRHMDSNSIRFLPSDTLAISELISIDLGGDKEKVDVYFDRDKSALYLTRGATLKMICAGKSKVMYVSFSGARKYFGISYIGDAEGFKNSDGAWEFKIPQIIEGG